MKKLLAALFLTALWASPAFAQCTGLAPAFSVCANTTGGEGFPISQQQLTVAGPIVESSAQSTIISQDTGTSFAIFRANGGGSANGTYFGQEGASGGALVVNDGAYDGVFTNLGGTSTHVVLGVNSVATLWGFHSGGVSIGANSPTDPGAGSLTTQNKLFVGNVPSYSFENFNVHTGTNENFEVQPHITLSTGILIGSVNDAGNANEGLEIAATNVDISAGALELGLSGTSAGTITFQNATSGGIALTVPTGALNGITLTLPNTAGNDTLAVIGSAQTFTAAQTFTNGDFLLKGSSSGAMTLEAPAAASTYVMTFPAATDTVAVLGTGQTFSAAETFTGQDLFNQASTITSATAAALDDILVSAETTTISGNTGSPITALSKVHLKQPTLTDSSTVTVTSAATLTIDNAPAQAGSVTITNPYALWVVAGKTLLAGSLVNSGIASTAQADVVCTTSAGLLSYQVSATGCASSSIRFKQDLHRISDDKAFDIVMHLTPKSYYYRPETKMGDDIHFGFVAEDVEKIDPSLITYEDDGRPHAVKYNELWPFVVGAIQKLRADNDNLRAEVQQLRSKIR
jgi:hypothetical protein